jgi:phosphotransferase system  glucose/maltose/N-acetylglucosamine-specific IIC component
MTVTRWMLSDDLYGDERERLRWYEGTAIAAAVQWIAVPWAAVVLAAVYGRPALVPLGVILVLMYLSTMLTGAYVRRRRVETVAVRWTAKRIGLGVLGGLPYVVFVIQWFYPRDHFSVVVGATLGAALGVVLMARKARQVRAQEAAAAAADED